MPKRLVGGVFLLCLTALTLTLSEDSETLTNITQPEILEQLTNLKKYIPNPSMIKPVWVQLKNGDEIVVVQGEMKVVDTGEFEIIVAFNGYKLLIHIEFTQVLNEDDEPIDDWYIDTNDAKYLFTSDYKRVFVEDVKNIDGEILSQLKCGDIVIKHDESGEHAYVVSFKSETGCCLTYADASCVETQSYDYVDDTGWVYNSQDLSFINRMEQIVDKDGHQRFIEGDIDLSNDMPDGMTKIYGKWSLSGSHLLIVLAIDIVDTTEITGGVAMATLNLPDWVKNKIIPLWQSNYIDTKTFNAFADNWSTQTIQVHFYKSLQGAITLRTGNNITLSADRHCRIVFDLLIDNE